MRKKGRDIIMKRQKKYLKVGTEIVFDTSFQGAPDLVRNEFYMPTSSLMGMEGSV